MFETTDFLSDPILSKIQTGIGDPDPIPTLMVPISFIVKFDPSFKVYIFLLTVAVILQLLCII